jgi:TPR repeat protein
VRTPIIAIAIAIALVGAAAVLAPLGAQETTVAYLDHTIQNVQMQQWHCYYRVGMTIIRRDADGRTPCERSISVPTPKRGSAGTRASAPDDGGEEALEAFEQGLAYVAGEGVTQSDQLAALWFKRAAALGSPDGRYNLAVLLLDGRGVPRDTTSAIIYLHQAAMQGQLRAQLRLAVAYEYGEGVPTDLVQAWLWNARGSAALKSEAERREAAEDRMVLEAKMTPQQLAEAKRALERGR